MLDKAGQMFVDAHLALSEMSFLWLAMVRACKHTHQGWGSRIGSSSRSCMCLAFADRFGAETDLRHSGTYAAKSDATVAWQSALVISTPACEFS